MLIRLIIQKLLKELDPGTVSCLPMNSVLSPLTVDGSTCFLLLNHMKLLPLRSAKATLLFVIVFFPFFSHSSCGFSRFPAEKLIKQKLASGPTGTEKLNRFLHSAHTIWFYKLRNMWFNLCCLIATVLPTIPLQDGEVSSSDRRSSTTCRCEATPSPDECCWWTPRKRLHASSTARRNVHPSSPTWCHRCPPYAASYATHAHEATSSWWSMIL